MLSKMIDVGFSFINTGKECNNRCWSCAPLQTKKTKGHNIIIGGGEPLLKKKVCDTSKLIDFFLPKNRKKQVIDKQRRIWVLTNGRLITKIKSGALKDPYLGFIVKLLAHKPELHDLLSCVEGSFEETVKGIIHLKKKKVPFGILFTIVDQNYVHLSRMVAFAEKLGPAFIILKYAETGRVFEKTAPKYSHAIEEIRKALASKTYVLVAGVPPCMLKEDKDHWLWWPEQRTKLSYCKLCSESDGACDGVSRDYLKVYGEEEFKTTLASELKFEVTGACNMSCEFCFRKQLNRIGANTKELSFVEKCRIIDSAAEYVKSIRFTGGEPLLYNRLFELARYAKDKNPNLYLKLNTNGILLGDFTDEIKKHFDEVIISFHELIPKKDPALFETRLNGIKILKELGVTVRINTLATKENIARFDKFSLLTNECMSDEWQWIIPEPCDEKRRIDKRDLIKLVNRITKYDGAVPVCLTQAIEFCYYGKPAEVKKAYINGKNHCGPQSSLFVDSCGNYRLCYAGPVFGNALQMKFKDAWNHDMLKALRTGVFYPKKCIGCAYIYDCRGGCSLLLMKKVGVWKEKITRKKRRFC
ncbi:MAG: radical SAM protein [Candidatus Woesearchaeota archaeon]